MTHKEDMKQKFARLTARVGVNIQPGQTAVITTPIACAEIARLIAEECLLAGAGDVVMLYKDEKFSRIRYQHCKLERLTRMSRWTLDRYIDYPKGEACYIHLTGDDPDIFAGLDADKIGKAENARKQFTKPFSDLVDQGDNQWTVVAAPTREWAIKLFPSMEPEAAIDRLWEAIWTTMRLDTADPVEAWQSHSATIASHASYLNESGITTLEITNSLGTDLSVGLAQGHLWGGGSSTTNAGYAYQANMPTEEVFTMPHRSKVNGRVVSSMPLCYQGNMIENFSLTFRDGQVVEHTAEKGLATLTNLLDGDPGCRRLGEVALVPYSSPIRRSGILFLNTLFDENASCHLALGSAYPDTMKGFFDLTPEQREERGYNYSCNHVDFMFGTADMSITGLTGDGRRIPVFADGEFAF